MTRPIPPGILCWCVLFLALSLTRPAAALVNVLTYHNDGQRTGQNQSETVLTPTTVTASKFGRLFSYPVDGYVYAQPLIVSALAIPGQGTRNVVFIATEHNSVYAFDADSDAGANSGLLWSVNLGPAAVTPNNDFGNRYGPYHDLNPEVGITGTPVIDPATKTLYVDAFTHEGSKYYHRLHALDLTTGAEKFGGPVVVTATFPGNGVGSVGGVQTFDAMRHLQRPALTLANGFVYIAYAGYADTNPYHGWVIGFNATTLQQPSNRVWNATPNSTTANFGDNAGEGGIWMSGCGLAVDSSSNLFIEIANGIFNANTAGGTEYGDSFVKLGTTNGLAVSDYFTPYNQAALSSDDTDLGSGGMILLPDQPGSVPHLAVGAGKEGRIYLLNRDKLTTDNSHYNTNTNGPDRIIQSFTSQVKNCFGTPAYFNGRVYYATNGDTLKSFTIGNGGVAANPALLSTTPDHKGSRTYGFPGATPSISANGTTNGIAWCTRMGNPAVLTASRAADVTTEIYASDQTGSRDRLPAGVKFTTPTIANGKVYVGGQFAVSVFGLFPAATTAPAAPSGLTATTISATEIDLAWTDNATNATGVKIERSTDNSTFTQIDTAPARAGVVADVSASPSTTYYYRVRATNSLGDSAYGNTASAATLTNQANVGLVGRWKLDDGGGSTAADSSGNTSNGTVSGESTWIAGKIGSGALSFHNGGSAIARVTIPEAARFDFTATQSFTLATWVNPAQTSGKWSSIIAKSHNLGAFYGLAINPGDLWSFRGLASDVSGSPVTSGWHQLTAKQDGAAGTRKLYVDGALVGTGVAQAANGTGDLWFAQANSATAPGYVDSFNGAIDDVRIYNRALSEAEIATLADTTWTDVDVGSVGLTGSATIQDGTFLINGSGANITGTADAFNYIYQPVTGKNFSVTARVATIQNTNDSARVGVMVRSTLAANSVFAACTLKYSTGVDFQRRKTSTDNVVNSDLGNAFFTPTPPYWVRVVRNGDTLSGYQSSDGQAWNFVASDTVPMGATVFVGIAVTSHDNTKLCAANVDNFSLNLPGSIQFSSPDFSASVTSGTATITAVRNGGTFGAAGVTYNTVSGGTAASGADYQPASGTLSWADGDNLPKTFTVSVLDDHLASPTKTVNLALSAPTGNATLGTQATAVLNLAESPLFAWRYAHFGSAANTPAVSGDSVDNDIDGLTNLTEYALASDPKTDVPGDRPALSRASNHPTFTFRRNTAATDLTYIIEASDSLSSWSPLMTFTAGTGWIANTAGATVTETAPSGADPDRFVAATVTDPTALDTIARRFIRLRVTK